MIKINIIYVGGIKSGEKYYHEIIGEYIKRLSVGFKIANIEIKEEKLPENPNESEIAACLKSEGKKILAKINPGAYKISLCVEGKKMPSEDFAALLYKNGANCASVDFIIGSSHGLSDEVKKSSDCLLSLSDMTFAHRLARVMLMEQIYRAYAIETGRKYHK